MTDKEILAKAFEQIKEFAKEQKINQEHIAETFQTKRTTANKTLGGKGGQQSLERILEFSKAYSCSLDDIFKTAMEGMNVQSAEVTKDNQVSTDEDYKIKSADHLQRIIKMQCASYIGFFIHQKDEEFEVNHIFIDTFKEVNSSAIPVSLHVQRRAGKSYHGHIVSPPNQNHLYLYLRQDIAENDRGMMIFHYFSGDVEGGIISTSGIMVSTDRNTKNVHVQWVALVRVGDNKKPWPSALLKVPKNDKDLLEREIAADKVNELDKKILESEWLKKIDDLVKPHLMEEFPTVTGEHIRFDKLDERHKKFHDGIYPQIEDMVKKMVDCFDNKEIEA